MTKLSQRAIVAYRSFRSAEGKFRRINPLKGLFNSIGFFSKDDISKGERQIERLKAKIEELSEQLRSVEAVNSAVTIELSGPGPFRLPLLTHLKSTVADREHGIIAEFESHDGKSIYAAIPSLIAAQIVNDDVATPVDVTGSASTMIKLPNSSAALRLPVLSYYNGHLCPESERQILLFSTGNNRQVLLPLSIDAYERFLRRVKTTLVFGGQFYFDGEIVVAYRPPIWERHERRRRRVI